MACAIASLWQAPVPWVHHHSKGDGRVPTSLVSRHMQAMHADTTSDETGWHLHFVMIGDILRGGGCPVLPDRADDSQTLQTQQVTFADSSLAKRVDATAVSPPAFARQIVPETVAAAESQAHPRRQFLGDLTAARRLQLMLCIARC